MHTTAPPPQPPTPHTHTHKHLTCFCHCADYKHAKPSVSDGLNHSTNSPLRDDETLPVRTHRIVLDEPRSEGAGDVAGAVVPEKHKKKHKKDKDKKEKKEKKSKVNL